jgi:protein TonB
MIILRRSPALRIACLVLALGVHAAVATAFMGGAAKEPAPPPEVELEILAAVTSEATPVEVPEVTADAMQASEASEAVSGDVANVASDMPEEVSSITPVETVTPPDPTVTEETVEREMPSESVPHDVPEAAQAQEVINETEPAETAEAVQPPAPEPLTEVQSVEPIQQAAEMSPVEPPQIMPPVDLETPAVEAEDAPKIAALTTPIEVVEEKPRVSEAVRVTPKPVKEVEKRKPVKQVQAKPAKAKAAAKPKAQRQMVAGSRESKVAKREGKSTAKRSGGPMASSAYRSIVQARLSARKGALQATASRGLKGYVIVSFSIGASGNVTRASVSKSSGNGAVDSAARAMVASTSFPPPPGGSFSARLPVQVK